MYVKFIPLLIFISLCVCAEVTPSVENRANNRGESIPTTGGGIAKDAYSNVEEYDHAGENNQGIRFHERCGTNVEFLNDRRTARKKTATDAFNAVTFTDRPMNDNELFEIRLDEKEKEFRSLGIGVTAISPSDIEILPHISRSPDAWMYHVNTIIRNNSFVKLNYGGNVSGVEVNGTVGVVRKASGDVHFYINGEDQGRALENMPPRLYGVVELWRGAQQVTIIAP